MVVLMWQTSNAIRGHLRSYMPNNGALDLIRTRCGLECDVPSALVLLAAYLYAASSLTAPIDDGGPGWLSIMALLCVRDAINFAAVGPVCLTRLPRALVGRLRDGIRMRREQPGGAGTPGGIVL